MDENNKKTLRISISKNFKNNKEENEFGIILKVEYNGKIESAENYSFIKNNLKTYLNNLDEDNINIIEIVRNIREITEDLDEVKLDVNVGRGESGEYAYYKKGSVDSCGAYKEIWDDSIVVFNNKMGVDIKYKKDGFHLNSQADADLINEELQGLYNTVITLNNMKKEKVLGKTLTKKRN